MICRICWDDVPATDVVAHRATCRRPIPGRRSSDGRGWTEWQDCRAGACPHGSNFDCYRFWEGGSA